MKNRQLHLWIGLLTSILVLVESVTGLLLAEPWLMGETSRPQMEQGMQFQRGRSDFPDAATNNATNEATNEETNNATDNATDNETGNPRDNAAFSQSGDQRPSFDRVGPGRNFPGGEGRNGLMGFVRNLHAGRIGTTDVSFVASITAVALIILTITGIVLSLRVLVAQSKSKQKTATQI